MHIIQIPNLFSLALFVNLFAISNATLVAAGTDCTPMARVSQIAPGVYVRSGTHGIVFKDNNVANIGFIVGKQCVAVIDTGGSYEEGRALQCAISVITTKPVCYVINTHVHPDHIMGNLAFKSPETSFVGHANLERAMILLGTTYLKRAERQAGKPLDSKYIVLPDRIVKDRIELDLGGRHIRITAHPKAHTDNDLSIFDEQSRTLWLSDLLFVEHVPVIAGSARGWIAVLEALTKIPADRVVPGHGPVPAEWPKAANNNIRYLAVLRKETRAWLEQSGELGEAQSKVGYSESGKWRLFDDYHKRNVIAVYTELEWED